MNATATDPKYLIHFSTNQGLTVFFEGAKPLSVASANPMYSDIKAKIGKGITNGLFELVNLAARIKHHSKGKFTLVEQEDGTDTIFLFGKPMPKALSDLVIKFTESGSPTEILEKFWNNCCANPSEESRQALYSFICANNMTLTDDGCFIGYRAIRHDWKDYHTGTMDNSIGSTPEVKRADVDPNSSNICSRGLHVAAWRYAEGFKQSGGRLIEVKVNPADVVTVPPDYNQQKMRVCKFNVLSEILEERKSLVHPSTFNNCSSWDSEDDDCEDDFVHDVDDNEDEVSNTKNEDLFYLNVTSYGGVNVPAALARKAGFKVGDNAYVYIVNKSVRVAHSLPLTFNLDLVVSAITVDVHNSIRIGSKFFNNKRMGDQVEAEIVTGVIEIR